MRRLLAFWMCLLLSSTSLVRAEELRPQLDDMVRHFGQVVFGDEYDIGETPGVISKWSANPVGIAVQGRKSDKLINIAARHVRGLTRLTGVAFKTVKPGTPGPGIDLIFMKRAEMSGLATQLPPREAGVVRKVIADPTMVCFFLIWHKPPEHIVKAMVAVNVERDPAQIDACLLEELTQVMGLPSDVDAYWPSMFNNFDNSQNWSKWDELYLKTLYDARLKPGMTPVEALRAARDIFKDALAKTP